MSDSWVEACGRSQSFIDPVDHLLEDAAAHKKFGFDMRTSYQRAQHHLLLTGMRVFFTPGMSCPPGVNNCRLKSTTEINVLILQCATQTKFLQTAEGLGPCHVQHANMVLKP